jgi:hypothetical protein
VPSGTGSQVAEKPHVSHCAQTEVYWQNPVSRLQIPGWPSVQLEKVSGGQLSTQTPSTSVWQTAQVFG